MSIDGFDAVKALWRGFVTLGGIAFIKQVIDWVKRGPKLIGDVDSLLLGNGRGPDGSPGVFAMVSMYLVNARTDPTTVRGWGMKVSKGTRKWESLPMAIVPDLKWPGANVDWKSATRIYDYAAINLLEYRKGIRGWIMFFIPGATVDDIRSDAVLEIVAVDALNHKHKIIKHTTGLPEVSALPYFPSLGIHDPK